MKFIKKNKFTCFMIAFFLILFALMIPAKNLFFPDSEDANYGDRLDGLTEIREDVRTTVVSTLKEQEKVLDASIATSGRILNIIISVEDSVSLADAKKIGESTKDLLDEDTLKNYDIQVFVKKENASENDFPIIGYKSKTNEKFSWTKDREKIVEEVKED